METAQQEHADLCKNISGKAVALQALCQVQECYFAANKAHHMLYKMHVQRACTQTPEAFQDISDARQRMKKLGNPNRCAKLFVFQC